MRSFDNFIPSRRFTPEAPRRIEGWEGPNSCNQVLKNNKWSETQVSGFSFLELIVVLAIIGILGTMVAPALLSLRSGNDRRVFTSSLQVLTRRAWHEALSSHQLHRIRFDLKKHVVIAERITGAKDRAGEDVWQPLSDEYVPSHFDIPAREQIKGVWVDGTDLLHARGETMTENWFFLFPDGTSQQVTIHIFDSGESTESTPGGSRFSLVLNPLTVRFTEYPTFQKP